MGRPIKRQFFDFNVPSTTQSPQDNGKKKYLKTDPAKYLRE